MTVVLLSLDRLHLTRRCVESIYAHADYPFELFIHDDGSQPETVDYLRSLRAAHGNVELFESPVRLGCAVARNRAFERIATEYVFSLDNDIVCHPGWLREAMTCAVRHDAAFVSPLRLEPDGRVWSFAPELVRTASRLASWRSPAGFTTCRWRRCRAGSRHADVATNFVCGGAGLFSRAAFRDCGGFTEDYHVGFEDMDFCLQMAARGYRVWATARAVLTHDDQWQPRVGRRRALRAAALRHGRPARAPRRSSRSVGASRSCPTSTSTAFGVDCRASSAMAPELAVSVVVPVLNGADTIGDLLTALAHQAGAPRDTRDHRRRQRLDRLDRGRRRASFR